VEKTEPKIPKWLKSLQENSWELELLISGGAIFSLFKFADLYLDWRTSLSIHTSLPGTNLLFLIGLIGINILTLGFSIHLLTRAYWLALVCINYVFPNGIDTDKIKWKKPYRIELSANENLKELITRVDRYCGIIVFTSIISIFALAGIMLLFAILFSIMVLFGHSFLREILMTLWFVFTLLYIVDFISFGSFRRIPLISYLTFPFFTLFDTIILRKHYQPALFMFNTNIKKLKFSLLAFAFLGAAITLSYLSVYNIMHWPNLFDQREYKWNMAKNPWVSYKYYKDQHTVGKYYPVYIDKKVQVGNLMEVYLSYEKYFDSILDKMSNSNSKVTLAQALKVNIDSVEIKSLEWYPTQINEKQRFGISCFIPIDNFANGQHLLIIENSYQMDSQTIEAGQIQIEIPFWINR
jgi:hypothetical protein